MICHGAWYVILSVVVCKKGVGRLKEVCVGVLWFLGR